MGWTLRTRSRCFHLNVSLRARHFLILDRSIFFRSLTSVVANAGRTDSLSSPNPHFDRDPRVLQEGQIDIYTLHAWGQRVTVAGQVEAKTLAGRQCAGHLEFHTARQKPRHCLLARW